jgi:hypothetical protein
MWPELALRNGDYAKHDGGLQTSLLRIEFKGSPRKSAFTRWFTLASSLRAFPTARVSKKVIQKEILHLLELVDVIRLTQARSAGQQRNGAINES